MHLYENWEQNEYWLDLPKFPHHQVSTYGRIRNKRNNYILKPFPDRYGYLRLSIGSVDNVPVHRLVCEAFYGPPIGKRNQVNHIDANRQNNHVLNLEWCTSSENIEWAMHKGNINPYIGLKKALEINRVPVRIVELDKTFDSVKECSEFLGVNPNRVSRCLIGERRGQRLHGYHIEYV